MLPECGLTISWFIFLGMYKDEMQILLFLHKPARLMRAAQETGTGFFTGNNRT
jgi:hypothetical protein